MLTMNDKELHGEILEALDLEPKVMPGEIGIAVEFGVATLTGTVHSFAEKWAAEDAVKRVKGVRGIANELNVDLPGMHRYNDTDIAQTAVNMLEWDVLLPKGIQVSVQNGNVALSGTVAHHYQKREAEAAIGRLAGVRSVTNDIHVHSGVQPQEVRQKIEARFQRAASFDAKHVAVSAEEGNVTLTGQLRSLAERDEALSAAWAVPGVHNVVDKLTIGQ